MERIVVGVTGASGIVLAHKAVRALTDMDWEVELVMSKAACYTAREEMGPAFSTVNQFLNSFSDSQREKIRSYSLHDFGAPIASGSYPVYGMLLIPCSMATLSAVAMGLSDNLIRRCADVTLKERRPLVLVPREAPLSTIHLENMLRVAKAGGVIVPPVPAWYNQPKTLEDVEWTIVGRSLDALKISNNVYVRWPANAMV